ncbi:hypothetical protein L6164_025955 [Bauhinia variegata]|uniref:Uncharacterized protein n=1 Tax=Bauhinia variegata TaxID=167791 RepID=A0ACB9M589_BAUVA|nr:hypothetical protein L6164_025955 [Bauhinia variegata]
MVMDKDVKDTNGSINKPAATLCTPKVENPVNGEYDNDSNSLLPPRRGGMSRNSDNTRRKVQWNDKNGNKLAEVLEFEPSDVSDSEEEDNEDSCICTIMWSGQGFNNQDKRLLVFIDIWICSSHWNFKRIF